MKKIWLVIVLILAVATSAWYFLFRNPILPASSLDAFPNQPIWLVELGDESKLINVVSDPASVPLPTDWINQLQAINHFLSSESLQTLDSNPFVGFYLTGNGSVQPLIVLEVPSKWKWKNEISDIDSGQVSISERNVGGDDVYELNDGNTSIVFSIKRGVLIMSTSSFLVESSLQSLNEGDGVFKSTAFQQVREAIYSQSGDCHYVYLPGVVEYLMVNYEGAYIDKLSYLKTYTDWLALNIELVDGHFAISGYASSLIDNAPNNLSFYKGSGTGNSSIADILPASTLFYKEQLSGLTIESHLTDSIAKDEFATYWNSWIGYNTTLVTLPGKSEKNNGALVIEIRDGEMALNDLQGISDQIEREYRSYEYLQLNPSAVIADLFDWRETSFCVIIDQYLIVAPDFDQLKQFIDTKLSSRNMNSRSSFSTALQYMLTSWNQFIYADINSLNSFSKYSGSEEGKWKSTGVTSIMVQINPYKDLFILHGYLFKADTEEEEVYGSWVFETDASLLAGPFVVYNQLLNREVIIVQDSLYQLYMISPDGALQWKRLLDSSIVGEVESVDFYSNDKIQMLFATNSSIQLIDMNGNDVEGFPIRLSASVTSGISVLNYVQGNDYRMFVGCANNNIYGFYKNGKPLPGWKPLKAEGALVGPLQHNLSEGRDYIAGATTNNLLVLKNRKGRNRTSPIELPDNILAGPVFESISDATQMVAIDAEGRLHRFYLDGSKDNTNLAVSVISSIFVDVDEDGVIDIVYNDQAGVFASTLSGEVKYKFDPGAAGAYEIQIIDNGDIQRVGLSSSVANNSYILNKKGNPIHTEPLPASGKLAWLNDSTPLAVIAGGNLIQCFAIE